MTGTDPDDCTCFVTPEHMWTRYGGMVETGSQMEPNPDCPVHFCQEPGCGWVATVVEEFDEQIGYEEKARPVRVIVLACGHEVVTDRAEHAS